jgi:hypothetical protein
MLIIALFLTYHKYKSTSLDKNTIYTTGKFIQYSRGVKTGGGVAFEYKVGEKSYRETCCQYFSNACENEIVLYSSELRKGTFPVVYDSENPSNAELLLLESQYLRFNIPVERESMRLISEVYLCDSPSR